MVIEFMNRANFLGSTTFVEVTRRSPKSTNYANSSELVRLSLFSGSTEVANKSSYTFLIRKVITNSLGILISLYFYIFI